MSLLDIMVSGMVSDGGMRPMLLVLLLLAVVFLVTGAVLALVALRSQRRGIPDGAALEQLEQETS